ncbi:NAD/NADP octopine/nopaline dehydrogenase family protein [Haloimpatiens sp. FM7315]|uniref:NAD/NADP octopine/nopaline dehydrogenase family protein n=1 Tax=Haloimpatiens sp. FM7315 TaxID=3298609 RepID=UPI0035A3225A
MKKVTVVGAGNGGMTAAYHFAKKGYEVCLYDSKEFNTQINAVNASGGVKALETAHGCKMLFPDFEKNIYGTTDENTAATFSNILVMICPSFAQEILFNNLLKYLKNGQEIILMPGNYGGLVLSNIVKEKRPELNLTFIDAISIPWATRIEEPGIITIMGIKEFIPMSIYPKTKATKELIANLNELMPIPVEILDNPLIAGLENINFGGHPLITTVNIGLLENFSGDFNYYRDCCSPATANACKVLDQERLSVGTALGYKLRTELEAMNALYACNYKTVYDFNRASVTHGKINKGPDSSKSRYISEDVPYLFVPCYELAKLAGLKVPIIEAIINLANAYNETNYFKLGRTLEKMGLGGLNLKEIKDMLS